MNTQFIDQKYITFLSGRLRNFRNKGNGLYEFSHDCEKANRRRGYFYKKGTGYNFVCHNCGASTKFFTFLQQKDEALYNEYRLEVFGNEQSKAIIHPTKDKKKEKIDSNEENLISLDSLSQDHKAWKYILKRKIPKERYKEIFYCDDFTKWASTINKSFEGIDITEPRLIFPYYNKEKEIVGYTCRSFNDKSKRKYIELKLIDDELIYGIDKLNYAKDILAVEGPLDSMFLNNCIASSNASYRADFFQKHKNNIIIVPDNDWKRNVEVCKQLVKIANENFKVSLLPDIFKEKDINAAIVNNSFTSEQIQDMIFQNVKSGPELLLEISFRRKC